MKNDIESKNLTWLEEFDKNLYKQRFFGELILTYQNGRIINAHKGENIKPFKAKENFK